MGRPRSAQHGTRSRYVGGCRCGDCTEANRVYQRDWYGSLDWQEWDRIRPRTKHGRITMYIKYGCRCPLCRQVNTEVCRRARELAATRSVPKHIHGTTNGYTYWGCRCKKCTKANTDQGKKRRLLQKQESTDA